MRREVLATFDFSGELAHLEDRVVNIVGESNVQVVENAERGLKRSCVIDTFVVVHYPNFTILVEGMGEGRDLLVKQVKLQTQLLRSLTCGNCSLRRGSAFCSLI